MQSELPVLRNCGIITCVTGGIYPDRAAKQQTPVVQVIISVSITGGIYPDRAAKQQTPVMQVNYFYLTKVVFVP